MGLYPYSLPSTSKFLCYLVGALLQLLAYDFLEKTSARPFLLLLFLQLLMVHLFFSAIISKSFDECSYSKQLPVSVAF